MQIRKSIVIAIIIASCFAPYFNTLFAHFVWDDNIFIIHNQYLKSFKHLPKFFTDDFWNITAEKMSSGYYRPLLAVSFVLDYALWHGKPFGYHLNNLIQHTLASVLIFLFLELLLKQRLVSLFSALIFSVHPIHTESVSFVSGRVDLLPLVFLLLSLIFLLKYVSGKRFLLLYFASLVSFFLALLSKEMAVTFPFIVLCLDYFLLSKQKIKDVIKNFPRIHLGFFLVLGAYLLMRIYFIGWSFFAANTRYAANFLPGTSHYWRIFTALKILASYIRLLFFPYHLTADYFFPPANSLWELPVLIAVFLLISLGLIFIKNLKNSPVISFSLTWFFITVLPVSNIVPIGNIFAERYMYIPSVGFCIAMGLLFANLLKKNIRLHYLSWKKSILCLFFLLILAMGRVTFERNKVWNNEFIFWYETAKAAPGSPRAHCNLASAYYAIGFLKQAFAEIKTAIELYPNYYEAFNTLGDIYFKKGLTDEAVTAYKIAIGISGQRETAYNSLAVAYAKLGRYKEAIDAGLTALKNNPYFNDARYNLALNYEKAGLFNQAIKTYEEYLKVNPGHCDAHIELGYLYHKNGDDKQARLHWLKALEISPDYKPAIDALKLLKD